VAGFHIASLVGKAYLKAVTVEIAVNRFHKTGLFPVNRNIFNEHEFTVEDLEQPGPSNAHGAFVLPADISPVPTRTVHSNNSKQRVHQGIAVLVTGSPHKQKVIEECVRKKARENIELGAEAKKKNATKER
jgi:hypothetical protein